MISIKIINLLIVSISLFLGISATLQMIKEERLLSFQPQSSSLLPPQLSSTKLPPSSAQKKKHVDKEGKYTIEFPSQWEVADGMLEMDVAAIAPPYSPEDLFKENANIISARLSHPLSRTDYYSYSLKSLGEFLIDFDLEKSEDIVLDGVEVRKTVFSHTMMGIINVQVVQYLILNGQDAYALTFTADQIDFAAMCPVFEEIAGSFKFTPK